MGVSISERIEASMRHNKISRYKLSKETGIPYTTLTQIINGRTKDPQVGALETIANYFDKPLDYFLGKSPVPSGEGTNGGQLLRENAASYGQEEQANIHTLSGSELMEAADKKLGEEEILTLAARRLGYKDALTKEQLSNLKLAIRIALAKEFQ